MPNAPPSASKELVLGQPASRLSLESVQIGTVPHLLHVSSPGTMGAMVLLCYGTMPWMVR